MQGRAHFFKFMHVEHAELETLKTEVAALRTELAQVKARLGVAASANDSRQGIRGGKVWRKRAVSVTRRRRGGQHPARASEAAWVSEIRG